MTLLELLVKELPKRGGWPDGVAAMAQDGDGDVQNYSGMSDIRIKGDLALGCSRITRSYSLTDVQPATDRSSAIVTHQQYEAALAASKKPVWSGEGLPPVGCDVEFTLDDNKYSTSGIIPYQGQVVNVVAHKVTSDGNDVAVVFWDDEGAGRAAAFIKEGFRPIRTEAERKRDEVINSLQVNVIHADNLTAESLYAIIESGKIAGVKLGR